MVARCWMLGASGFDGEAARVWPDNRRDYGESRSVALGYVGLRIMVVVFVDCPFDDPTERRISSSRKAKLREVQRYAKA